LVPTVNFKHSYPLRASACSGLALPDLTSPAQ